MNILKKIICGILTATVGVTALSFNAVSANLFVPENSIRSGDYDYVILEDGTACLVNYHGSESNLVLPAQIDGKLVTTCTISFGISDSLKTINCPESITKLTAKINNEDYSIRIFGCRNFRYMHLNNLKEIPKKLNGIEIINIKSGDNNVNTPIHHTLIAVEPNSFIEAWVINQPRPIYYSDNRKWRFSDGGWRLTWYFKNDQESMYGWHRMDDKMYYLDPRYNGLLLTGWRYIGNAWYYLDPLNGGAVASGWLQPAESKGAWYYCDSYGIMKTGWIFNEDTWYYLDPLADGAMASGWFQTDKSTNTWYYCDSSGAMRIGWVFINGSWYYLDPLAGGAMAAGWLQPDKSTGTWYYCDPSGAMKTGWIHLDSGWYYLNSSGEMLADTTTPDGYYVDSNGVWIP